MPTNFLQAVPTSSAGWISNFVTLISSELVSLASSGTAISAATFTSTGNFSQALWADIFLHLGGSITPSAGAYVAGWFMRSPDGGGSFETSTTALPLPRSPDFIIPLSTLAYASSGVAFASGIARLPFSPCKVYIQNNTGATLPSSASAYTYIGLGPDAVQY